MFRPHLGRDDVVYGRLGRERVMAERRTLVPTAVRRHGGPDDRAMAELHTDLRPRTLPIPNTITATAV